MLKTEIVRFAWLALSSILWSSNAVYLRPLTTSVSVTSNQYTLPPLPYAYAALEPAISREIMQLHHQRHHQRFVTELNKAVKEYAQAVAANDLTKQIGIAKKINFNGGGFINHSLFWTILKPLSLGGGQLKNGALAQAVKNQFGGLDQLKAKMNEAGLAIEGSGWVWLSFCLKDRILKVVTTGSQDTLTSPLVPIIGIDVWEHAYYLQYKNDRAGYLTQIWTVINFDEANTRFTAATARRLAQD